jgi:7,8-dihydropterin-6-yl-methyl-4-(beta-D-ribofuranosyl)aminobenzene 5'-phosphate synthase
MMKVTTLIENRPSKTYSHLAAEWGLSLYITFNGHNILFDTGASGSFAKNAEHLSICVASIDTAVLSHHHFDHGGGLRRFFDVNTNAMVHLGQAPNGECFTRILLFMKKYVGLEKALITDYPNRFKTISEPTEILPDVFIFPHLSGSYPKPAGNKRLFVQRGGKLTPDDFSHEIVMAIKENNKLVIFTGCSHNGILNMVDSVAREFKGVPIKAVFGGIHLVATPPFNFMAGSKREVEDLAQKVLDYPIEQTFTGHCTGTKAFAVLKGVMGDHIADLITGSSFEV